MPRVRRLVRWTIVTVGIAALVRWLRGRRAERARHAPGEAAGDPADELRRKLAESRSTDDLEATSTSPVETVEERRADVHEQARATLSEMTPDDR
jgi:hypothetical protein